MAGERRERQHFHVRQRVPARNEHAAVPLVAGHRHEIGERSQRLGGDPDVGIAARSVFGHLDRIALVQRELDAGKAGGEIADHAGQHVARLRVRGGNGEGAFVFILEFGPDALHVLDFPQRAAGGGDHRLAGRRHRRDALADAHEDPDAELVFQLPHLLAHAGLRREQARPRRPTR